MRTMKIAAGLVMAVAVAAGSYVYLRHSARYPSTDDAYINADVVHVAAEVAGPVAAVRVNNQDHVRRAAPLFAIDREPYRLAMEQARAHLENVKREVAQDDAGVASAQAEVHNREVLLDNARIKLTRTRELLRKHYASQQASDDADAAFRSAAANLRLAQAQWHEAQEKLGTPGERNQRIQEAQAALGQAQWNLQHTQVSAACDGRIAEFTLHQGDSARVGVPLFVLVCDGTYTVNANYKETEIAAIRPGQPAEIRVDNYPGHRFVGRVVSVNAASGVAFSLLPPQNATGNWVKVTQRVPVKIRFVDQDPQYPLRVGTSAVVTIDTQAGAQLAVAGD